ncbi:hypothetical protein ABEO75_22565 [Paenibacillus macerans]|uniref:hypothetical protein n=1 Tax=Paenibacillus macerans TaxID=44252 RepID=UPI002E220604|nr:hypothetical protein [Paenibacillus macerans]
MLRKIAEILKELLVLIIALTGIAVTVYMQYRWDSFGHRQRALIEEGDAELAASAFDSALTLYDRALEINPHNAEALKKKKRSEEVIRAADSLVRKGEEAMRLGQLDEAYDYFVQAKKLFPLNPNDGYQRNLSVFEKDWVRTYLDALQQLDENWTAINLRLQKGETATSESVMNDIADMSLWRKRLIGHLAAKAS